MLYTVVTGNTKNKNNPERKELIMLKKRIATLALAGIMAFGGMGVTSFATTGQGGGALGEFIASGKTMEGLKAAKTNLDEKGITLEEAKANFDGKISEFAINKGITVEEAQAQLAAFKESGQTVEGLQNVKAGLDAKGLTLEEAKANFEAMLGEFATAGGISVEEAQAVIAGFKADGKTFTGLNEFKAGLAAKGITLDEAKANFEGMFGEFTTASGLNPEDAKARLSEMKANGKTLEGMKNIKDIIGNIPTE